MNLILNESDSSQLYNMGIIHKYIYKFYKDVIGIEYEESFFNPKEAMELEGGDNFRKLFELITGIAAQCDKRGEFLHVMQNMDTEDSTELFTILTERISAYTDTENIKHDFKPNDNSDADENTALYLRIESLELENGKLHEEVKNTHDKISELTKSNFTFELQIRETEGKYQELVSTLENMNEVNNKKDFEDTVALSIQLSEMKGKLEAKEKNLQKVREEKEKLVDDYKMKLLCLQKESEGLREKSVKYDILKEKMEKFSIEEINSLKNKIFNSERVIKDQEEKIKKLKNYDVDKSKLLKKIEELNFELSQDKEKNTELMKENNYYKDTIIQSENDVKFLKKQIENLKNSKDTNEEESTNKFSHSTSLLQIEEDANEKRYVVELEAKVKFLQKDKEDMAKEKTALEERLNQLNTEFEEGKKELAKLLKKTDKYAKFKEEKHTYITKITDLMEKVHQYTMENENLKLKTTKEKSDLETLHNVHLLYNNRII